MTQPLGNEIHKLQNQVKQLVGRYSELKSELKNVKAENKNLKTQVKKQNESLDNFQYQAKISKIVENLTDGNEGTEALKSKIDDYIKEIDNCITYLDAAI